MIQTLSYDDIQRNRDEIIDVFYSMINENSNTNYSFYSLYKDSFEKFAFEVIEMSKITNRIPENIQDVPYIEEDKYLIIQPKNKNKTIIEMFEKI